MKIKKLKLKIARKLLNFLKTLTVIGDSTVRYDYMTYMRHAKIQCIAHSFGAFLIIIF